MSKSNQNGRSDVRIFTEEEDARFVDLMSRLGFDELHALLILMECVSALEADRTCIESAWLSSLASDAPYLLPIAKAMIPMERAA